MRQKNKHFALKSTKGMSLIEVMVVLVIMSLVGLGTTTLLKNVMEVQRKGDIKAQLMQVRKNLKTLLENDTAWTQTVEAYPFGSAMRIDCLNDSAPPVHSCRNNEFAENFDIRDHNGNIFYQASSASQGFGNDGQTCSSYSGSGGNEQCPFRYNLRVDLVCTNGAPTCRKPQVTITATLVVSTDNDSGLARRISTDDLSFQVIKRQEMIFEPFHIRQNVSTDSSANSGSCTENDWEERLFNQTEREVFDVGDNATVLGDNFTIRIQPGTYECTVTAQAFHQPAGFKIGIRSSIFTPNPNVVASGVTPKWGSATVSGKFNFTITTAQDFTVEQYCPTSDPNIDDPRHFRDTPAADYHRGVPIEDYADGTTLTDLYCVRTN